MRDLWSRVKSLQSSHLKPSQINSQLTPRQGSKSWQSQLSPAQSSSMLQIPELNACLLLHVSIQQQLFVVALLCQYKSEELLR